MVLGQILITKVLGTETLVRCPLVDWEGWVVGANWMFSKPIFREW